MKNMSPQLQMIIKWLVRMLAEFLRLAAPVAMKAKPTCIMKRKMLTTISHIKLRPLSR